MFSKKAIEIFQEAIKDFKQNIEIDKSYLNKYDKNRNYIAYLLYKKCWIDSVQWTYEDFIRDPFINPEKALKLKRKIDRLNQDRTDTVELIDEYFLNLYKNVKILELAKINTESPAWALDRLSILALKIFHMHIETLRHDATEQHKKECKCKLQILIQQRQDLSTAIDELLNDISKGKKLMKTYKQMKMYNDEKFNPFLRKGK